LTKRANKSILTKQKALFYYFQNSQVVADPVIALAFIFSPFGIKHQNGINLGPLTPLPHQNLQIRVQRQ
jgi:tetrahydromethanopterin S-methyltransferase subunit C